LITAKMRRTGHSSYSITRDTGAPEVADSRGPPAMDRWAGGASPPLFANGRDTVIQYYTISMAVTR